MHLSRKDFMTNNLKGLEGVKMPKRQAKEWYPTNYQPIKALEDE